MQAETVILQMEFILLAKAKHRGYPSEHVVGKSMN